LRYVILSSAGNDPPRTIASPKFKDLIDEVPKWAADFRKRVGTDDLWEIAWSRNSIPGDSSPGSVNSPFTEEEQKAISGQLKAIAESVKKTYELTAEQSAEINKKFEEAEQARDTDLGCVRRRRTYRC
jgi:coenzyme F420-reducing hydrogenase alpha subunit